MKFTPEYFLAKFEAIPEELWTTDEYVDDHGRKCALGHCGFHLNFDQSGEGLALQALFHDYGIEVTSVNDHGAGNVFPQETPRARMIAALRWILGPQS